MYVYVYTCVHVCRLLQFLKTIERTKSIAICSDENATLYYCIMFLYTFIYTVYYICIIILYHVDVTVV